MITDRQTRLPSAGPPRGSTSNVLGRHCGCNAEVRLKKICPPWTSPLWRACLGYGHCVALGMAAKSNRKSVPPYCY